MFEQLELFNNLASFKLYNDGGDGGDAGGHALHFDLKAEGEAQRALARLESSPEAAAADALAGRLSVFDVVARRIVAGDGGGALEVHGNLAGAGGLTVGDGGFDPDGALSVAEVRTSSITDPAGGVDATGNDDMAASVHVGADLNMSRTCPPPTTGGTDQCSGRWVQCAEKRGARFSACDGKLDAYDSARAARPGHLPLPPTLHHRLATGAGWRRPPLQRLVRSRRIRACSSTLGAC